MHYQQLTDHCQGVSAEQEALLARLAPAFNDIRARNNKGATPLINLASRTDDLAAVEKVAAELRARFRCVIVAGTGGSGLSGRTLLQLKLMHTTPSFHFMENIDPDTMDELLARVDLEDTCFLIISKSGSTAETLSQYYVLLDFVEKKLGREGVRERFVLVTVKGDNPMRRSAAEYNLRVLDHDSDVGGRYAILSVVGLLPAAIAGMDIRALRKGAQTVIDEMDKAHSPAQSSPAVGAVLQYGYSEKKYHISVMLPYAERLSGFSSWYRQNWAESLGKDGKGTTPIRAVGTTDQHSQLQLYLDGPKDKFFHMIMLKRAGQGPRVRAPQDAELDYLRGKTMGDVMAAEQKATLETLVRKGCPVRVFKLDQLNEESLGALLMHFTLEIIFAAALMGINPFDQPAVEEGKELARDYLLTGNLW